MDRQSQSFPCYREVQQLRQVWLWALVLIAAGAAWWGVVSLILASVSGENHAPSTVLIIATLPALLVGVGVPLLVFFTRLVTEVRSDGIYFQLSPFHRTFRRIPFEDVKQCEVRTYRFTDYGGWSIRHGKDGWAYNISGFRGVQLELMDGRRIMLGSQRPEELCEAIRTHRTQQAVENT